MFSDLVALVAVSAAVADAVIAVAGVVLVAAAVAVVATASATGKPYTHHTQRPLTRLHPSLMPGFQGCGTDTWGRGGAGIPGGGFQPKLNSGPTVEQELQTRLN